MEKMAPVFSALADPTRLRIVARICEEGPLSITRLVSVAPISRQALTKHLSALEKARIVSSRRSGRERIWELHTEPLGEAQQYIERISQQWDDALERLRRLVE